MAAGVHRAGSGGGVRKPGSFEDGEGVHIGAEADDFTAGVLAAFNHPDHAGATDAGFDQIAAELFELLRDQRRSAMGVEKDFRILVDVLPPRRDLRLEFSDTGVN